MAHVANAFIAALAAPLALGATPSTAVPAWGWGAVIVAVIAVAGVAILAATWRKTQGELARLRSAHEGLTDEHKQLQERARQLDKKLDSKREAIDDLKHDVAAQRKKVHEGQKELKRLRTELKGEQERAARSATSRPAFSEPAAAAPKSAQQPAPAKKKEADAPKATGVTLGELQKQLADLQSKNDALQAEIDEQRTKTHREAGELRSLRKRVEDYRRVDVLTKSKLEVVQDRVRHLGRQYYDAVSEIALLKGEVAPPPQASETSHDAPAADTTSQTAAPEEVTESAAPAVPPGPEATDSAAAGG